MVCTKCGKESAEGTKFCGECGLNVEPVSTNDSYVVAKWKKDEDTPTHTGRMWRLFLTLYNYLYHWNSNLGCLFWVTI